jgi:hypothetical protein
MYPLDIDNGDLGPCEVTYKGNNVGFSKGGNVLEIEEQDAPIMYDQTGAFAVNHKSVGKRASVKLSLAEVLAKEIWTLAFPGWEVEEDAVDPTKQKVEMRIGLGASKRAAAGVLILKKYVDGEVSADPNDWFTFYLAVPVNSKPSLAFDTDTQRVLDVTFECYQDFTAKSLGVIGDATAEPAIS